MTNHTKTPASLATLLLLGLCPLACQRADPPALRECPEIPAAREPDGAVVLAVVNGLALTRDDVRQALGHGDPRRPLDADLEGPVLETLIRKELAAQGALARGLKPDAHAAEEARLLEARARVLRRGALAEALYRAETTRRGAVTDADLAAAFDANADRIRTELHVEQILCRSKAAITAAEAELRAGAPFEAVAAKELGKVPAGERPWDLGFLKWAQIPEAWRAVVYDLQPGSVSPVIEGPGPRYWLVRLVEKRRNDQLTVQDVREPLAAELREARLTAVRGQLDAELRAAARIERRTPPPPSPEAPAETE